VFIPKTSKKGNKGLTRAGRWATIHPIDTPAGETEMIMTVQQANKIAKANGLTRGKGTYNGEGFWVNSLGHIVTMRRLAEIAHII
jgi:hypothetical protein